MGIFGWSYPPGCSSVPGDKDEYCEICGKNVDDCVCPECPVCGEYGNPKCYGGTPESIAAFHKLNELTEDLRDYSRIFYGTRKMTQFDFAKLRDDINRQIEALGNLPFQGHGLEVTQQQIESFNDSWDRIEEEDRRADEYEKAHPEFFGGE